jgi:hypothetical protein
MMNNGAAELKASGLLLDVGVVIPVRPLAFLNFKGKSRSITVRHPYWGGLIRMSRQWLSLGLKYGEIDKFTPEQDLEFFVRHGCAVSMIVAGAILRGRISYLLFGRVVAWWLRWRVHPSFLVDAMGTLTGIINIRPFKDIIRHVELMNLMKPRLSHKGNGS